MSERNVHAFDNFRERIALERARVSNRYGAGDSPSGEAPAPPPGILEGLPDEMREKLPDELVDELLAGAKTEEEIFGQGGLFGQLTKRLVERAMEVELTDHLGYEPHQEPPGGAGNTRNGKGRAEDACDRARPGRDPGSAGS